MINYLYNLGRFYVNSFKDFKEYIDFCLIIVSQFLTFKLFNPAVFLVTLRQIYFTGVQIIKIHLFIATIVGIGLVGLFGKFLFSIGAYEHIGKVLVLVIIREFAPLITTLLLSFRSSTAIGAEIATMKLNNEIKTLNSIGINEYNYLFLPRVFSGVVCIFSLSVFFAFVSIMVGYFILSFKLNMTMDYVVKMVINELSLDDIACFIYKTLFFGFVITTTPIFTSMTTVSKYSTDVPISLLKGMMRLFYGLIFVEITGSLI